MDSQVVTQTPAMSHRRSKQTTVSPDKSSKLIAKQSKDLNLTPFQKAFRLCRELGIGRLEQVVFDSLDPAELKQVAEIFNRAKSAEVIYFEDKFMKTDFLKAVVSLVLNPLNANNAMVKELNKGDNLRAFVEAIKKEVQYYPRPIKL